MVDPLIDAIVTSSNSVVVAKDGERASSSPTAQPALDPTVIVDDPAAA